MEEKRTRIVSPLEAVKLGYAYYTGKTDKIARDVARNPDEYSGDFREVFGRLREIGPRS